MFVFTKRILARCRRWLTGQGRFDRVNQAIEKGDYPTVFRETDKIIARSRRFAAVSSSPTTAIFFHSAEEYRNYIRRNPVSRSIMFEFPAVPEAHFQRAVAYRQGGRLKSSSVELERSLAEFPSSAKYLTELGFVLLEMKYYVEAAMRFGQAIEVDLTNSRQYEVQARRGLGIIAMEDGGCTDARRHFLGAWRLSPQDQETTVYLQLLTEIENDPRQRAEFYVRNGNWERAVAAFKEALVVNPQDYEMHLGIAFAYKELQQLSRAERHIKRAFQCNPCSSEVNFALGYIYMLQDDFERAEIEFNKAIARNCYDPLYFVGLARLYLERISDGHEELGSQLQAALSRAHRLDPDLPEPDLIRAEYYLLKGQFAKALRAIRKAIEMAPDSQEAHILAAEIYLEMGRRRRVHYHLSEAADFGRDTEQMRALRSRLQDDAT